jgi:hypothetical protein
VRERVAYPARDFLPTRDCIPLPANYFHHKRYETSRTSTMTIDDDDSVSGNSLDTPRPFDNDGYGKN